MDSGTGSFRTAIGLPGCALTPPAKPPDGSPSPRAPENGTSAWAHPVDVTELGVGSILVSDDRAGALYRITFRR
jgi:hypothetical protein